MAQSYRIKLPEQKLSKGASLKEITLDSSINRGDLLKFEVFPEFTYIVTQKTYELKLDDTYRVELETDLYKP
ncbi:MULTISPECIES: hypothetical protein [Pseudomonas]|uniref:Uncharacterized protein n=1 Tax=Pseudomonas fluorescens TaxID=294 RepID=A0A160A121_PSEFL|nr:MULTISPECIES: hypothetical protein [Pseudomonas]AMZ73389.1 hypothetical protein TK06_20595 [Pseudomonas fluorescens]SEK05016.1 hypothetical protein SAMN03159298_06098 [Pseudomonas sp. NFACC07-1]